MFWILLCIGTLGGVFGLLVLILSLPPIFRYQMIILEACAKGQVPTAFDAEYFNWSGNMWTLFPLPVSLALILLGAFADNKIGGAGAFAVLMFAGIIFPASLAVLAITHSPLQSLNPVAIGRLLKSCGDSFWLATVYLVIVGWASVLAGQLPNIATNFIQLFALFSFSAVVGTLIAPYGLVDNVSIPDPATADEEQVLSDLEGARNGVLTHAYGFISRGHRSGGLKHIKDWIADDPDPAGAWAWFFNGMLRWEQQDHALFLAQHYIHDMLEHGETVPAVKAIMRCRLINEAFKPLPEDMPAAIAAAESSDNIALANVLKRY
jgi:hypothetical protein